MFDAEKYFLKTCSVYHFWIAINFVVIVHIVLKNTTYQYVFTNFILFIGYSQSEGGYPSASGSRLQTGLSCNRSSSPITMQSNRGRQPSISESPTCGR
jgi:hypothetical protein